LLLTTRADNAVQTPTERTFLTSAGIAGQV
jgi:hypothetical protein